MKTERAASVAREQEQEAPVERDQEAAVRQSVEQQRRSHRTWMFVVVALVIAMGAGFALGSGQDAPQLNGNAASETPESTPDPTAALDAALASGTPAFVLIHSLT